jgi:aspartyl-tRNA(Asn)/glutamyl-tRNA(Gln) amidotransferase subunit A
VTATRQLAASSVAATTEALERIESSDNALGAFVDVQRDQALAAARALDDATDQGLNRGPLHGVPIGVKELFDVADADGSYGSGVLAGRVPLHDAAVVALLRLAGAVVIGTTRSHEFGWGITTQHATRGSTRNPWNLDRVPGGSSGGSAAAVSAGMVPLAVGSDTGGSIRLPAAFCGVLGLKTTFGRISRVGGAALAPSFDSPGFLARTVALLTAAFTATACTDYDDPATALAPDAGHVQLGQTRFPHLRFALPTSASAELLDTERSAALDAMAAGLRTAGLQQVHVSVPDGRDLYEAFVPLQMAEALDVHTTIFKTYPTAAAAYGADVRSRLELAARVTVGEYLAARRAQDTARATYAQAFNAVDIIVSPVGSSGPSRIDRPDVVTTPNGEIKLRDAMMPYTTAQNLVGLPSITCPVSFDRDGMPIGIQLTGAHWSEPLLLSVAFALEAREARA